MPPRVVKQVAVTRKKVSRPTSKGNDPIGSMPSAWDFTDIKMSLYGRSGTGKTTLWSTFPGPILAVICSGGKSPGELRSINTPEMRKKVTAKAVQTLDDIRALTELAKEGQFKTVVLDHATSMQDLVLKSVLGVDEIPEQKSWGLATQQQWGQVTLQTIEYLRSFLDLPCNVVIVAQEREFNQSEEAGEIISPFVGSRLSPKVTDWLNFASDYICQTLIKQKYVTKQVKIKDKVIEKREAVAGQVEYCLRVAPDPVYMSKFRVPLGKPRPELLVNPTYAKIMTLLEG